MAQKVAAPKRFPRSGGIKAITGDFIIESRLGINDSFVYEDSECEFPALSRAGCIDDAFPKSYDDIVIDDDGDVYTLSRVGDTVTVHVVFTATANSPEGVINPWPKEEEDVVQAVTGGTVTITALFGLMYSEGSPTGSATFSYDTQDYDALGYYPDFAGDGPEVHGLIAGPFAQYKGIGCFLGGDGDEDGTYMDQARRSLIAGEDREIELRLWRWAIAASSTGTADSLVDAIAAAEEHADTAYVYRPTLMMSRGDAQIAFEKGALKRDGDLLYTGNGTPVLASGAVLDADAGTVVILGTPAVYASEIVVGTGIHPKFNRELAIAQRIYGVGVDCDFRHSVVATAP